MVSRRPYPRLAELWHMVARSAYYQLRYSPVLLACTIVGLLWLYLIPPVAAVAGLIGVAAAAGAAAWWCAAAGLAGWLIMAVTYLPVLRLYRLSPLRAVGLPTDRAHVRRDDRRLRPPALGGPWRHLEGPGSRGSGSAAPSASPRCGPR